MNYEILVLDAERILKETDKLANLKKSTFLNTISYIENLYKGNKYITEFLKGSKENYSYTLLSFDTYNNCPSNLETLEDVNDFFCDYDLEKSEDEINKFHEEVFEINKHIIDTLTNSFYIIFGENTDHTISLYRDGTVEFN